jgi:NAD(P)H-nitrite reductase large subunit
VEKDVVPHYVIIGNGVAGLSAASAIRSTDRECEITVFSDEPHRFYSRPGLAYLLTGTIPEKQLYPYPKSYYQERDIRLIHSRVEEILSADKRVRLADGGMLAYDALLMATGARAIKPRIPGVDLNGVVTLDTLSDARRILKLARRARRAVVIGGGITALELAEGLAARGVRVHYLLRKDRYWSNVLDGDESHLVLSRLEEEGIQIHTNTELSCVVESRGRVGGVETDAGERIGCEILAIAIGIRPRLDLAEASGVDVDRGIIVDQSLRTNLPEIYAAGDTAQVHDPRTGEYQLDTLWWVAAEQGRVAGLNMAGGSARYVRAVPFNVTRIGRLTTTIIGAVGNGESDLDLETIARGDSESWRQHPTCIVLEQDKPHDRVRLILAGERILGALIMGDQSLSKPLQYLISKAVDITPIRRDLLARDADWRAIITDHVADLVREAHAAGN